jgi:NADPH-dependent 2,4-dienoyl-CoA reductase/sulfur reductase-like enzyme
VQYYDYIIIGLGICGATAAETIRKNDPSGSILVLGDETYATYSRVLLPHVVRGKVGEEKVFLKQDAAFAEQRIDIRRGVRVTHVDTTAKTVVISAVSSPGPSMSSPGPSVSSPGLTGGSPTFSYKKLLIATGGTPKRLECEGADTVALQRLQTIEDARAVIAAHRGTAVVIGGGFIALELLMSYVQQGSKVIALVRKDGFFSAALDDASRHAVNDVLRKNGVDIRTSINVIGVRKLGEDIVVRTDDGEEIVAQTAGLGIGLDANIAFLEGSGIVTRRGVVTDALLRTNIPDVYAAGDVAEFLDPLIGTHHVVGNWQNALFQAKLAGENMTGGAAAFSRVTAYSITCFGTPISFLGATDIAPDRRVVREKGGGQVVQLLVKDGRIIGATCIGPFSDRASVTELIEGKLEFSKTDEEQFLEARG